jgi:hypothetical protein
MTVRLRNLEIDRLEPLEIGSALALRLRLCIEMNCGFLNASSVRCIPYNRRTKNTLLSFVGKSWLLNAEEDFFLNLPIRINRQNRKSI